MYACTESGCTRTFKRPEHLSRHRLNHRPRKIHQCHICRKDFVRLDLLQRHIRRHDRGMAYRNSGGYSTTGGAPGKSRPDGETASPSPVDDPEPAPAVEMCRQSTSIVVASPAHEQVGGVAVGNMAHMMQPTSSPSLAHHVTQQPGFNERTDMDHLTFFDGSHDAAGLTQDLEWLFGSTSPWDMALESGGPHDYTPMGLSETSPESELSHGSAALSQLESTYSVPREGIMSALASLPPEILTSSFFDATNLDRFMQSYWHDYNPHFSLLHRATFSMHDAHPLLLVALLTLGATLSPEQEHYHVAEQIHENLRWLIFTSPSFHVPAPLWVIQALLVVQSYEKMFSTRKLHEMSHIFHYSVITLMRRGSCYSLEREEDGDASSMEKAWHRWTEREMSYRAAYFAFIMDAQHSSIFGHTAALSLTDIHLPLPCADVLWEAPTAAMWHRENSRTQPAPLFLPALRALLARHPIPPFYSPFARFVLLHGLFCLTRHMISRDQTASCINVPEHNLPELDTGPSRTPEQDNWKDRLDRAIDTWSFSLLSQTPSLCLEAARPLRRIAHVSIQVPLVDFHVLAGAPNLATGVRAPHESVQFTRAFNRVKEWAQHRNAKRALSHCLLLIQETMFTRARYTAADDRILLRPWVLYNVTLVLWAYGIIMGGPEELEEQQNNSSRSIPHWTAEEYLAHMLNCLLGDGGLTQHPGVGRTGGLVTTVRIALEDCRWELLEEAKETLNRISTQSVLLLSMVTSHGSGSQNEGRQP